ncbi:MULTISPECIES: succinate dehydrogenase cytochrome b subunit [unclassified Actinobaculum]|uniref:succinate dehydrogenase cytochrome b subunit n=1 Tax=unclassified Actinobaculum TaxID=2609299 RepID=UPI000F7428C1|nr:MULTISPECIES: succinate dehydrogenase cytochrome b subunit [unclassified Actinobaculum]RTE50591.1 succinate dehydrogenase cytochrome b subunit [Actinobaculum sp. 352]
MATSSLPVKRGRQTTVALKVAMAVTGLIFVLFVLFHMYGNLKLFMGAEAYNHYAEWLHEDLLYPILPHKGGVWILRVVLLLALCIHVFAAYKTWQRGRQGRGAKYKVTKGKKRRLTYASRTMRYGGLILFAFIIFHILQFTALKINIGANYSMVSPYERVVAGFSVWWCWLIYLIAMCALCLHVRHGVFSALATLGLDTRQREFAFNLIAWACALALLIGFMAPPTAILVGWIS